MIRPMQADEAQLLGDIWLRASKQAHDFIDSAYWDANLDAMVANYLPNADTHVCEQNGKVYGFISLVNNSHIAAIFVNPSHQGTGIGSALMRFAKQRNEHLTLTVYKKNHASIAFYEKHGFTTASESIDEATNETEITMKWERPR